MKWNTQTIIKYLEQDSPAKCIEALGKFVLGVAAIVAASQTGKVLDEVSKVKDTLTEIQSISREINHSNQRLENAVEHLRKINENIFDNVIKLSAKEPEFKDNPKEVLQRKIMQYGVVPHEKDITEFVRGYKAGENFNELSMNLSKKISSSILGVK